MKQPFQTYKPAVPNKATKRPGNVLVEPRNIWRGFSNFCKPHNCNIFETVPVGSRSSRRAERLAIYFPHFFVALLNSFAKFTRFRMGWFAECKLKTSTKDIRD